ncbi:MAG: inositol-3-phosphate synthase [Patescibacteria group bacterium]
MKKEIRVCIVGVGNCSSSLHQGIGYYKNKKNKSGLIFNKIGSYSVSDINIVSAFDINQNKIGKKFSNAIFEKPNNAKKFFTKHKNNTIVKPGPILDGLTGRTRKIINEHGIKKTYAEWMNFVVSELKLQRVDVLVSYLPVGSKKASIFYARCALKAKVAYANAIPEFICSSKLFSNLFLKAGVPCAGDDVKSQIGATIIHRVLVDIINKRGFTIDNTFQLNIGGNLDFLNMLDESRLISKRISKTEAVTKNASNQSFDTKIGPSDYVSFLNDNKICFIEINGKQFGGVPFKLELKLSVEDSPNSAGVMVDVIRLLKICLDKNLKGYQDFSSFYFKHPQKNMNDNEAYRKVSQIASSN